jgi:hypothetical protein
MADLFHEGSGMRLRYPVGIAMLLFAPTPISAQLVEEVRTTSTNTPTLPEDLFNLPPGDWALARKLWEGREPCTTDECEAGYTTGDLVVSVERNKEYVRIIAGFRNCASVAWSEYKIGKKASSGGTKTIRRLIGTAIETSAKYCKVAAPSVASLDASRLYPSPPESLK